jgi:microcin C transport system permease protein
MVVALLKLLLLAILFGGAFLVTHKLLPRLAVGVGRALGLRMKLTPLTQKRVRRFKSIKRGYYCLVFISTAFVLSLFLELVVNNKPLYVHFEDHGKVAVAVPVDDPGSPAELRAQKRELEETLRAQLDGLSGIASIEAWDSEDGLELKLQLDDPDGADEVVTALERRLAELELPTGVGSPDVSYPASKTQFPAVASWLNFWLPLSELPDEARRRDYGLSGEGELNYRRYARWVGDPGELTADADRIAEDIAEDEARFRGILAENAQARGLTYNPESPLPAHKLEEYSKLREKALYFLELQKTFEAGRASIVMPLHPYSADEQILDVEGHPPHRAFQLREEIPVFGTDYDGKDVLAQLAYGFRVSFAFAIVVAFIGYTIGVTAGAIMGFFGGWTDILIQRFIEVWSSIPFLFTIMIIASITPPSFWKMVLLLVVLRAWVGITYTIRGEFFREKARDYVQAASAIGVSDGKIMARHIFPNALVPVVTFLPFSIVAYIGILVSLDFLGFGLPPETPSWGRLLRQATDNIIHYPTMVIFPVVALAVTLFCVVIVGEAVREAFDPKKYSRLR